MACNGCREDSRCRSGARGRGGTVRVDRGASAARPWQPTGLVARRRCRASSRCCSSGSRSVRPAWISCRSDATTGRPSPPSSRWPWSASYWVAFSDALASCCSASWSPPDRWWTRAPRRPVCRSTRCVISAAVFCSTARSAYRLRCSAPACDAVTRALSKVSPWCCSSRAWRYGWRCHSSSRPSWRVPSW